MLDVLDAGYSDLGAARGDFDALCGLVKEKAVRTEAMILAAKDGAGIVSLTDTGDRRGPQGCWRGRRCRGRGGSPGRRSCSVRFPAPGRAQLAQQTYAGDRARASEVDGGHRRVLPGRRSRSRIAWRRLRMRQREIAPAPAGLAGSPRVCAGVAPTSLQARRDRANRPLQGQEQP
jgi:hypothetical protein